MKNKLITQKNYAMLLVPMMAVTLICNFVLSINVFGEKAARMVVNGINIAVLVIGLVLICAAAVVRKSEAGDELSVLNRYKSFSLSGVIFFAGLFAAILYFIFDGEDFTLRVDLNLIYIIISAIVIVEESFFLWFDRSPKEAMEEE